MADNQPKEIDLENIINTVNKSTETGQFIAVEVVKESMREAICQALEIAAEQVKMDKYELEIDKQSITDAINIVKL